MPHQNIPLLEKELSWLSFNERVLQEAACESVPLIQRIHFLGIFSSNLDEFFRVRVADVSRMVQLEHDEEVRNRYAALLVEIQQEAVRLQGRFDQIFLEIMKGLNRHHVYLINEQQLDSQQSQFVRDYFRNNLLPLLDPIVIDPDKSFPTIIDGNIYLAIRMAEKKEVHYAVLDIPTDKLPRFVRIPHRKGGKGKVFIVLDNIIRHCLKEVFRGVFAIREIEAFNFKITRDAELEVDHGFHESVVRKMALSLKKRQKADPERFVYDSAMPADLLEVLVKGLNLTRYDSVMAGGRYHNARDFMNFPSVGKPHLESRRFSPLPVPGIHENNTQLFATLREQDILLYYPYHSFQLVVDLLKTAAIDPAVQSIHITLYRVARDSRIVDALINARNNQKEVVVVVELKARFDEAANINWAGKLSDAGIQVIFGAHNLKVHSKLILITRIEKGEPSYYSYIGSGNFNEKTSLLYTDFGLLTHQQEIGREVSNVFDFLANNYRLHQYRHLLVSPHTTRSGIAKMIERERKLAKQGNPAAITIKCNNLVDGEIIHSLYAASAAGVKIRVICRGMCALVPGVAGVSENIEVISIVDSLLEHARVLVFHNNGKPRYFISSADLMTRNLDHRVEVSVPILDRVLQQRVQDILDIQWADNTKARILDPSMSNELRQAKPRASVRSQWAIHDYLATGKLPPAVAKKRKHTGDD